MSDNESSNIDVDEQAAAERREAEALAAARRRRAAMRHRMRYGITSYGGGSPAA